MHISVLTVNELSMLHVISNNQKERFIFIIINVNDFPFLLTSFNFLYPPYFSVQKYNGSHVKHFCFIGHYRLKKRSIKCSKWSNCLLQTSVFVVTMIK